MATVGTITEVSYTDIPNTVQYGTGKKRVMIFVRVTSSGAGDTLDLSTYISGLQDIEGISSQTIDNAVAATSATWSTVTLTFAGHAGAGVTEMSVIGTF